MKQIFLLFVIFNAISVYADNSIYLNCTTEEGDYDLIKISGNTWGGTSNHLNYLDSSGISRHIEIWYTGIIAMGTKKVSIQHAYTKYGVKGISEYQFNMNLRNCTEELISHPRERKWNCSYNKRYDYEPLHFTFPNYSGQYTVNRESLVYGNGTPYRNSAPGEHTNGICSIISQEKHLKIINEQRIQIKEIQELKKKEAEQKKEDQLEQLKKNKI